MIECKLEDFEKYRSNLTKYASGLLRTRGYKNNAGGELDELSKDMVQDVYLIYHKHHKDPFVNEFQLNSYLKTCLYNRYREVIDIRRGNVKYMITGKGEFDQLDVFKHPTVEFSMDEIDALEQFKKCLKPKQIDIIDKLLLGHNMEYIAKERDCNPTTIHSSVKVIRDKYEKFTKYR